LKVCGHCGASRRQAQREMSFAHPFAVEFKRLACEAVKRKG
jgi:hypothetical protein